MPTHPLHEPIVPPPPPLRNRIAEGAKGGGVFAVYLMVMEYLIGLFEGDKVPLYRLAHLSAIPRVLAFVAGFMVGGALLRALKPFVSSVWSSMLLFMLCLVPICFGTGLMVFGWHATALLPLVLTFPLGASLGFIDWNNLYRSARPRDIPS